MGSKSNSTDQTSSNTKTTVIDRKAVQQQGQQILDSVITAADDKVIAAGMAGVAVNFKNLLAGNAVTVQQLKGLADTVLSYVNKSQVDISAFGLQALEGARATLLQLENSGSHLIDIADMSIGKAMTMAEQIARDQSSANRQALEIVADTKTGDFTDLTKYLSVAIMGFALLALIIVKDE